ncbi:class I SAM-dependent methyltransferase [Acidisphaera sp. L21]|uniref:class I SAM-dependent methyltransferase n=1 Tax=Acidisphaera sp. L21 TaxID=1641851 RepID=UPI00131DEBCB|nr:class I SAM-dependent methyltransferase [Acidisphaera sp. L21]
MSEEPLMRKDTIMVENSNLIDVKDLIGRYSNAEHVARADAYFAGVTLDDKLLRKPFFGIPDTRANMQGIGEVLQHLRLFPGARVLDFGAGTGWFSRILAMIECHPIAVDVSPIALNLGERAFGRDPTTTGLAVEWRSFDGLSLPVESGSIDRIVCYDSFHHVADQAAILSEFYRALTDGGRVAFHEPGPQHSTIPVSQYEMRRHGVIENDIVVEEIWRLAESIGFSNLELTLSTPRTLSVPLNRYSRIINGEATVKDVSAILDTIVQGAANLRVFSMTKGDDVTDSRSSAGLAGVFDVVLAESTPDLLRGRTRVTNTGSTPWRPSSDGRLIGNVALGVQRPDDTAHPDFGRIWLSDDFIMPGQTVSVDFSLPIPPERPARFLFDLVSEGVTWFEQIGSKPVILRLS